MARQVIAIDSFTQHYAHVLGKGLLHTRIHLGISKA